MYEDLLSQTKILEGLGAIWIIGLLVFLFAVGVGGMVFGL